MSWSVGTFGVWNVAVLEELAVYCDEKEVEMGFVAIFCIGMAGSENSFKYFKTPMKHSLMNKL